MLRVLRTAVLLFTIPVVVQSVNAQPESQSNEQQAPELLDYQPESAGLKQALVAFREQLKIAFAARIRYHNSESQTEESRYRREWYESREPMHELQIKLMNAALEEYLTDPRGKPILGAILFKSLKRHVKGDNFEGMLVIAQGLLDSNFPDPELAGFYTQCCIADNEFELARKSIVTVGYPPKQLDDLLNQVDRLAKNWEEELEARKRDAAGEPLPQAKINTTKGAVIVELFENEAPEAVASFISLAEKGFYDYSDFFMVIDNFAAQTGCPKEDGSGGPGYMLKDEFDNPNARKLFRGSLVLATLRGRANSGGSQFYIPFLPTVVEGQKFTVFGRVISGMHNLANLNRIDPQKKKDDKKNEGEAPKTPDEVINIEIIRKRNHPYEPTRLPPTGLGTLETNPS
jgi:cyclophilin family peptidyl-prolyl cis-trans isomerase